MSLRNLMSSDTAFVSPAIPGSNSAHATLLQTPVGRPFCWSLCRRRLRSPSCLAHPRGIIYCCLDNEVAGEVQTESPQNTVGDSTDQDVLNGTRTVSIEQPLGVFLDEALDGRVFIDELIEDGNAAKSGLLHEGDVIVAVSLPYGDGLTPVPEEDGIDAIENHMSTRHVEEKYFKMAVKASEGVEEIRREIASELEQKYTDGDIRELVKGVFVEEYPMASPEEDGGDNGGRPFQPTEDEVFDYGFEREDLIQIVDKHKNN